MHTKAEPDGDVRILAARLRVTTDQKLGKKTPDWVSELADERLSGRSPSEFKAHDRRVRILAARLRVTADRKLGKETPKSVIQLAGQSL